MAHMKTTEIIVTFLLSWSLSNGDLIPKVLKEPTLSGFRFSCKLSPGPVTDSFAFSDPAGFTLGACGPPPSLTQSGACVSGTSPQCTVSQDITTYTTEVEVPAGYMTTSLTGDWKCAHGSEESTVTYNEILAFNSQDSLEFISPTSGTFKASSTSPVVFTMKCVFPSAIYRIEYQAMSSFKVLKTKEINSSQCENTNATCSTVDGRAYGQICTFNLEDGNLEAKNIIVIKAMVTGMLSTNYPSVASAFIVTSGSATAIQTTAALSETTLTTQESTTSFTEILNHSNPSLYGSTSTSEIAEAPDTTFNPSSSEIPTITPGKDGLSKELIIIVCVASAAGSLSITVIIVVCVCILTRNRPKQMRAAKVKQRTSRKDSKIKQSLQHSDNPNGKDVLIVRSKKNRSHTSSCDNSKWKAKHPTRHDDPREFYQRQLYPSSRGFTGFVEPFCISNYNQMDSSGKEHRRGPHDGEHIYHPYTAYSGSTNQGQYVYYDRGYDHQNQHYSESMAYMDNREYEGNWMY